MINILGAFFFCNKYYLFFQKNTTAQKSLLKESLLQGLKETWAIWSQRIFGGHSVARCFLKHDQATCPTEARQYQGVRDTVLLSGRLVPRTQMTPTSDIKSNLLLIWRNWPQYSGSQAEKTNSDFK